MSAKSVCGMSCGEMHEFALVLDKAGFNADLVQKIVNSKGNKYAKMMYVALAKDENKIIETNPYLKRLSGDTPIIIPACDGSHTLAKAKKVFKAYIDSSFKNYGLVNPGEPTKETAVVVYEIFMDRTFAQMFDSFGVDLDKLCFTQHQIEIFCEAYPEWFRDDGYGTFFLTKKEWKKPATIGNLFVAHVDVYSDGLYVHAYRFEDDYVWGAVCRHRLVVPQLNVSPPRYLGGVLLQVLFSIRQAFDLIHQDERTEHSFHSEIRHWKIILYFLLGAYFAYRPNRHPSSFLFYFFLL